MFELNSKEQFTISSAEYDEFCKFLENESGIKLGPDKKYLVINRLNNLLVENSICSITALLSDISTITNSKLKAAVIDAMTTQETNWFRDIYPYLVLVEKILPEFKDKPQLRIWSAACSTGQEPYTISMCVSEYGEKIGRLLFGKQVKIVGTDISISAIEKANLAEYNLTEINRGIDIPRLKRFFDQLDSGDIKIKAGERERVVFQAFNLLTSFDPLGKFDIVFCRNVLIYFSTELKIDIINRIAKVLNIGGYLILGASEFIPQECTLKYKMINCEPGIIYQKT